ncbi:MAG: ketoacyl-ACP synthase III [Gemmatimonadales bacterium]|nr:MAG: ketoacyl-ACP synthase III [Gemmatimonadales bacterium]
MRRSAILGTGFCVPDRVVTNDDLAGLMDTSDQWIRERTGIEERRWVREGQTSVDLALPAAQQALEAAGLKPTDLDAIVFATSSPDHFCPGNGVYLQRALGAGHLPALDIRAQCPGFVYGLSVADAWIRSGQYERILVVGQEIQSTGMDISNAGRHISVIFADGAGAAVLGPVDASEERGLLSFDLHTDGDFAESLWVDAPGCMYHPRITASQLEEGRHLLQMDGRDVFRHAVTRMPESATAAVTKAGYTWDDVHLLIPHQANLRISEAVQKSLNLRDDQVYNNIMRYGNTTAATIPIALDECARSGRLKRGDLLVLTAFGSGFMWGSCVIRW